MGKKFRSVNFNLLFSLDFQKAFDYSVSHNFIPPDFSGNQGNRQNLLQKNTKNAFLAVN